MASALSQATDPAVDEFLLTGGVVLPLKALLLNVLSLRTCRPSPPWGRRGIPVLLHALRCAGSNKNGHKGANAKVRKMIRAWNPVALFRGVEPSVTVRADERSIPARAYLVVVAEHMVRRLPDPRLIPSPG